MRKAPEALPKGNLIERAARAGAAAGALLASALVIGETPALASADRSAPKSDIPARADTYPHKPGFIPYPSGVRKKDVLTQKDQIEADAIQAMSLKKVQWNGVMILHRPIKNTAIGFTDSPRAYDSFAEPSWIFFGPDKDPAHDKSGQLTVSDPFLLQEKVGDHNRLFALVYTPEGRPAYLDVKFAEDMGAVTFYAYNGSRPGPMPVGESSKPPYVDYNDKGRVLDNSPADTSFADSHIKLRHGHLSDVLPHM